MPLLVPFAKAALPELMEKNTDIAKPHTAAGASSTVEEHLALSRIRRKRTCPSVAMLRQGGEAIKRHLKFCAECRDTFDSLHNLVDFSGILPIPAKREQTPPAEGQIRGVREDAGECGADEINGLFFRPPLVVVIQVPKDTSTFVRVAQLHDEPDLRGPGDVPLKLAGIKRFAESWNTYPLLTGCLGPVLGSIPDPLVSQILAESKNPFPKISDNEILNVFRALEINVAYHCCRRSVGEIVAELEGDEITIEKPHRATIHAFRPPVYDDYYPTYQKPGNSGALAAVGGVIPLVGCLAGCFVGGCAISLLDTLFKDAAQKDAAEKSRFEKKDNKDELKKRIMTYMDDTEKFSKLVTTLYKDICSAATLEKIEASANKLYHNAANARKAADAVISLAAILTCQANNGEISPSDAEEAGKSVEKAVALAEKATETASKVEVLIEKRHSPFQ